MNTTTEKTAKRDRLSLFAFIDAFGWELVQQYSFLDDILVKKAPLGTQFGFSSTCIPTILTGRLPRDHGHFTFYARANGATPFKYYNALGLIPRFITKRGRVRTKMSAYMQRLNGFTGYFQLYNMPFAHLDQFDYTEKRDIFEPGGINGGCPTIFDHLRDNAIPAHWSDWRRSEEENMAAAGRDIDKGEIGFAFLYLAALDGILHQEGKSGEGVRRKLDWYERNLRDLVQRAEKRYHDVRLYVFSDHGMTETVKSVPLMDAVNAAGLRFGKDYLAAFDSTMARFWFNTADARNRIVAALENESNGHILSDEELAAWGCDFPDDRYGESIYLMDPGHLLCPSFMGEKPLAGMHGYHPDHADSVAAFMASAEDAGSPGHLTDMFGLMRDAAEAGL